MHNKTTHNTLTFRLSRRDLDIIDALVERLESSPGRKTTRRGPAKVSRGTAVRYALLLAAAAAGVRPNRTNEQL